MNRLRSLAILAFILMSLQANGTTDATAKPRPSGATAVISLTDTGINPYHVTFRDDSPRAFQHPSTYIPGYPKSATALRLSLHEKDYRTAVTKDCERIWSKVEEGKLYWFPGTRIVGAITFSYKTGDPCSEAHHSGFILDSDGHGTMTASRAASSEYGACPTCRIVSIQFSASLFEKQEAIDSISWAAANSSWIDAQSNSWAPFVPGWEPTGAAEMVVGDPELIRTVEEVSKTHLAFWSSGNGAAHRAGAVGHPTLLTPHLTPSAISVGGHDSGYLTTWTGFPPLVVSDACESWAAYPQEIEKSADNVGMGTSAATPFAAGGALKVLIEARRLLGDEDTGVSKGVVARGPKELVARGPLSDGKFTFGEWKRLVLVSATPRPVAQREDGPTCGVKPTSTRTLYAASPVKWADVPSAYPEYLHIGYGAVDDPALKLAFGVLRGTEEPPDRTPTDAYFEKDHQVRETTYGVWSTP